MSRCANCSGYSDYMGLKFGAITTADMIGASIAATEDDMGRGIGHAIMIGVATGVLIHVASKFIDKVFK